MKQEKLWSFDKARNVLIEKIEIWAVKNIYLLRSGRTAKLLMFRLDVRKKGVCSKSVTKTLYRNKFLVSERILELVCQCESCRLSDIGSD